MLAGKGKGRVLASAMGVMSCLLAGETDECWWTIFHEPLTLFQMYENLATVPSLISFSPVWMYASSLRDWIDCSVMTPVVSCSIISKSLLEDWTNSPDPVGRTDTSAELYMVATFL